MAELKLGTRVYAIRDPDSIIEHGTYTFHTFSPMVSTLTGNKCSEHYRYHSPASSDLDSVGKEPLVARTVTKEEHVRYTA